MGCGGSKAEETGVRAVVGEGTTSAEAPVAAKEMIVATETAASDEVATAAVDVEVPEDSVLGGEVDYSLRAREVIL